jgi:gliding motility-associated-like protein
MQLTVSNGCLPNGIAHDTIRVFTRPTAGIAGAINGCIPHKIRLTNTTINARPTATYLWDFGNGDTSTAFNPDSITYATPGTYIARLIVSDTCGIDTAEVTILVSTAPIASFTSTLNCRGDSTAFTNTSTVAMGDVLNQVRWFFHTGDSITGNNPKYRYPSSGIFPVTLRIRTDKNCIDSVTANVNVLVAPNVSFTNLPASICDGQIVAFDGTATTALGSITDYKWKFTPTDSSMQEDTVFVFPGPGTYPVLFRATNDINCSTDTIRNVVVHPNPDSRPTASVTCFGLTTLFRDSSVVVGAGNSITQWEWDFNNDGITNSTSQHPSFTYGSVTTFRVKLRVGTNNNCFNTDSVDVVVNPLPNVAIGQSHAERCRLDSFTFTNTTTGGNSFIWRFGNGDTLAIGSTAPIDYAYQDSGSFVVKMIATSAVGCRDSATLTAISRPFPQANFVLNDSLGCAPKTFTFTNTSLLSNTYQWFVGSTLSHTTLNRPDTNILVSGQVVPIRLVAFNSFGCRPDTLLRNLQTFSNPVPDFSMSQDSGCGPLPVSFTNTSSGGVLFTWTLGNGITDNNINTATNYVAAAVNDTTYFVKLVASNGPGCSDSITKQVRVFPNPIASYTQSVSDGCGPLAVNFTNTSLHNFGGNINDLIFQWTLGNGNNPTTTNANTTYVASAVQDSVYATKLVATSRFGCKDSMQQSVRVYPNPTANFIRSISQGCGPLGVSFTNTSVPNDTGTIDIMTFQWSFGNGNISSATNPTQSFISSATADTVYAVKLIAVSEHGCLDSITQNILVFPDPISQFDISDTSGCSPHAVSFTNTSIHNGTGTITNMNFVWDLGNGFNSINQDANATYFERPLLDTVYFISLIAVNQHGCRDTSTQRVRVHPKPITGFTQNQTQGCGPLPVQFTSLSQLGHTFFWNFGDGNTSTLANPLHVFQNFPLVDTTFITRFAVQSAFGCLGDTQTINITTRFRPVADFTPSRDSICSNESIFFSNQSLGGINANWNFGNGNTSTAINPSQSFAGLPAIDTIYNVRLVVATPFNCRDTIIKPIRVTPPPQINISTDATALCKLDSFTFFNNTINVGSNRWIFNDGSPDLITASTAPFKKAFADSGNFTVQYIATSPNGCIANANIPLISRPFPVARFTTNDTVACAPKNFTFSNTSQVANTYSWLVNNVPTTTTFNRPDTNVITPNQLFSVKLIAFNSFGCRPDTAERFIRTITNPTPDFVMNTDSGCGPLPINFTNTSSGATSFSWNFGNGTSTTLTNPVQTFVSAAINDTIYQVKLIAFNGPGCRDSITKTVRVFPTPLIQFTPSIDTGCGPLAVSFNNNSQHRFGGTFTDLLFNWNFNNGNTSTAPHPSETFVASLTKDSVYQVKLVGTTLFGCKDSSVRNLRVYPNATAFFSASVADGCGPLPVNFLNQSRPNDTGSINIMSFQWNFGNGQTSTAINPSTTLLSNADKDTVYTIKLLALSEHGCPDSTTRTVRVYPKPLAQFSVSDTAGCGPLNVQFTNQSNPRDTGSIDIMTFFWEFGNNQISTLRNPTTQYLSNALSTGTYQARLIAYSEHNCADTMVQTIRVFAKPIANFTSNRTQGCGPLDVQFTNTSQLGNTFNWNFGNGDTSQAASPSYTFASRPLFDSIYQVRMVATSVHGCLSDTALMNIIARPQPVADFITSGDSICGAGPISFFNASQGGFNSNWNFGNGNTSSLLNPIQQFAARTLTDTTYQVRLVITSPFQCRDTMTKPVVVKFLPEMNVANIPPGCTPYEVQFANNTQGAVNYEWDFGDGNTSTQQQPLRVFENPIALINRTFAVTLRASTAGGCSDTSRRNIVVQPKPLVDFNAIKTNRCDTVEYQFLNSSLGASSFNWSFGNGNSANIAAPTSFFNTSPNAPITYQVKLIGITNNGCRDSIEKPVLARPLVKANFSSNINSSCENLDVDFTNLSVNANSYFWFFGDGSGSSTISPTKRYNRTGLYDVTLIAFDAFGCSDTITRSNFVEVFEVPVANFLFTPPTTRIPNAQVQFSDLSFISDNSPLTHQWFFGENAATSTLQNPNYTYTDSGNFVVTMIVTSNRGCTDTISKPLRVNWHKPIADFAFDPASGCTPHTVNFTNLSQFADNYLWDFGDATQSTEENPTHTYTIPNTYNVALIARGPGGDSIVIKTAIITVHPLPIANFFVTPFEMVLPNATVSLTDLSFRATQWDWRIMGANNGVVFRSNDKNPTYNFVEEGEFSVRLIVQNEFGCRDTTERNRVVRVIRGGLVNVPNVFTPNGDGVNDRFRPVMSGVLSKGYKLSIYNRWGMRVFETNDINDSWDGMVNGQPAATDAYVWIVEGLYEGERKFTESGTVTLLR